MEERQPGRHTRRAVQAMTREQLRTVAAAITPGQLAAAVRLLIDRDPALARSVLDAAIAERPVA
ncbi:MAG: hypothetical protein ACRDOH_12710 [Streptosporangiaceae bacterium]